MPSLENSNLLNSAGSFFSKHLRPRGHSHGEIRALARRIRAAEKSFADLNNESIKSKAYSIRESIKSANDIRIPTVEFAGLIAESVFRTNGFRLFDVQIQAIASTLGNVVLEMQTGEGKTIVTGSIAALKTLQHTSVHVSTTNTYLAQRDLESLADLFRMLDISFALLPEESNEAASRRAYRSQIVYGPGYQFGFDYLRDQMHLRQNRTSRLGLTIVNRIRGTDPHSKLIQPTEYPISLIDEADSVMIDEATTPLIISLPSKRQEQETPYHLAHKIAEQLQEGDSYQVKKPGSQIEITEQGDRLIHEQIEGKSRLQLSRPWRLYINNALRAQLVLKRDEDYVVVDDEVQIVDQYTGRILPDRTWQDGLHQAVEVKEQVPIKPGRESTTQITRQRYLQMYEMLIGLTGTARSVTHEFQQVYRCRVSEIPTNKPCLRKLIATRFFADQDAKLKAVAEDVVKRHQAGQPVLVGTRTIRESKIVYEALVAKRVQPTLLNGVQDQEEAEIVADAGKTGAITIATNMAGRGTDIKPDEDALHAGGLHVVGFSPNYSKRIDRQLIGRAARQGQPGSAQFFAAASDSIFTEFESSLSKSMPRRANRHGETRNYSSDLNALQEKIEKRDYQQRQDLILRDRWMDSVRESIEKQ